MKRFVRTIVYLLSLHAVALLFLSAFRLVEYKALEGLVINHDVSPVGAFVRGLWFDNVVACYVLVVPLAVLLLGGVLGRYPRWLRRAAGVWFTVFYALVFAASAANIPYFAYFFKNINSGIFGWFGYTATTAGMVTGESSFWGYIGLYAVALLLFAGAVRLLRRRADLTIGRAKKDFPHVMVIAAKLLLTVVLTGACLFGIRGRMGYNPIKVSQAYYCNDAFLNQLGINPAFNLLTSTLDDRRKENRELRLMPVGEAIAQARRSLGITGETDSLHVLRRTVRPDSTVLARRDTLGLATKPNVVIILMESMSASFMQAFGHPDHLTPTLDSLYRHSLAFSRFYSAGIHTNHGMTAGLYSVPALMFRNLMKGTVTPHREGLPTVLKQQGYHNLFFMTHEAQYDNMKAFFQTNGYDDIYSQENYPRKERVNAFGVPDHYLFQYALPVLGRQQQPFMATLLTISNHPPYVIPSWFHPHSADPEEQIVEYADHCIGRFLAQARTQPWYRNTVFVVMADHGKLVGQPSGELPESYNHIPLMVFGPGVPTAVCDGLGQQVDLMPTLLGLLGMEYSYEGFGVDLLRQQRPMVFYSADTQIVARDAQRLFIYNPKAQQTFCYEVLADGQLKAVAYGRRFADLRRYAFSMAQTAQYVLRQQ